MRLLFSSLRALALGLSLAAPMMLAGCERQEEVLEVETPEGELEVEDNVEVER